LATAGTVVGVAVRLAKIEAATPPLSLELIPKASTPGRWASSSSDRDFYYEGDAGAWWVHTDTSEQYTDVSNGLLAVGYTDIRGGTSFNSSYDQPYGHSWKNDRGETREVVMETYLIVDVGSV
jgi:hypothetical protein